MNQIYGLTHLEKLEQAIKTGTYNIETSDISQNGQGHEILTIELLVDDDGPIDMITFNGLVEAYGCIVTQLSTCRKPAPVRTIIAFFIERLI